MVAQTALRGSQRWIWWKPLRERRNEQLICLDCSDHETKSHCHLHHHEKPGVLKTLQGWWRLPGMAPLPQLHPCWQVMYLWSDCCKVHFKSANCMKVQMWSNIYDPFDHIPILNSSSVFKLVCDRSRTHEGEVMWVFLLHEEAGGRSFEYTKLIIIHIGSTQ